MQFIAGTLTTSVIALLIAVPVLVAVALYITNLAPRVLRGPLSLVARRWANALLSCTLHGGRPDFESSDRRHRRGGR